MLTVNVDLEDRLVNGQLGTVKKLTERLKRKCFKNIYSF